MPQAPQGSGRPHQPGFPSWLKYLAVAVVVIVVGAIGWFVWDHFSAKGAISTTGGRSVDTPAYKLAVTGESSSAVGVTPSAGPVPSMPDFLVGADPGVNISLPNGAQPATSLTLRFDFTGKPSSGASGTAFPAVVAVSAGSTQPEVLRSRWDPAHQTLTAQTDHLSSFFPITVDLTRLGDRISSALNGYLGLASAKPNCVGRPLVVNGTAYTLDPTAVAAAWPCLSNSGDKISIDLASNSPNGWIVRSRPATTDQTADLTGDVANGISQAAYQSIFAASVGTGTFLLPGGTTHLRFDKTEPPQLVGLRADPGVTLINGVFLGLHALFPNARLLEIPDVITCVRTLVTSNFGGDPTGAGFGDDTNGLVRCITEATNNLSTKPGATVATVASKSVGAVLSLGPEVATQLAANVRGFIGEFTGENTETITVHAPTTWTGVWSPHGVSYPATVTLSSTDPITGKIDIPGQCGSDWTEINRNSATSRAVDAHVTWGNCSDNRWNVTIEQNTMTGVDSTDPQTTFSFTRS